MTHNPTQWSAFVRKRADALIERHTVNASRLILSLSAALFLAISGCSTPCESVCSSFNDCPIDKISHDVDCSTFCGRVEQFQQTAASSKADTCQTEFDAYISCWEKNIADICNAENTQCEEPRTAWTGCMAKFCAVPANFNDQACVVQEDDPATPEVEPALPALEGF